MSQNDIFNKLAIHSRGIPGNVNMVNNTDVPILSAETCWADGFTEEYLRDYVQGTTGEQAPHIKNYMLSTKSFNHVLGKTIDSTSARGSYVKGKGGGSLHQQALAAYPLILGGEIQLIHIALKVMGWSGVKSTFRSIYTDNEGQGTGTTGWQFDSTSVISTSTGSGCGGMYEVAKDLYGVGGTNVEEGYIDSDGNYNTDSRNTHASITTRGSGLSPLEFPVGLGVIPRLWETEKIVKIIKDALIDAWGTDFSAATTTDDARTWKLFTAGGVSSSVYNGGDLDGTNGYPDAVLAASLNKNMLTVSLDVFRQPHSGYDVNEVGIDDGLDIEDNIWKIVLNGQTWGYILLENESIGAGKYQSMWTVVLRGLNVGTPTNDPNRSRIPAFKRCGRSFSFTWDSVLGGARFSFYTDSGDELTEGSIGRDLAVPQYFEVSAVIADPATAAIEVPGVTD